MIFQTERLIARTWSPAEDAADAYEMYSNWNVMRWITREPESQTTVEEQREKLAKINDRYRELDSGTGFWALEKRDTGALVGAVILKHLPDEEGAPTDVVEVGWHLKESEWGHGYATEAGAGAIEHGFSNLKFGCIHAVVYTDNARSRAVMDRLGMRHLGDTDRFYGVRLELYQITRDEWLSQR